MQGAVYTNDSKQKSDWNRSAPSMEGGVYIKDNKHKTGRSHSLSIEVSTHEEESAFIRPHASVDSMVASDSLVRSSQAKERKRASSVSVAPLAIAIQEHGSSFHREPALEPISDCDPEGMTEAAFQRMGSNHSNSKAKAHLNGVVPAHLRKSQSHCSTRSGHSEASGSVKKGGFLSRLLMLAGGDKSSGRQLSWQMSGPVQDEELQHKPAKSSSSGGTPKGNLDPLEFGFGMQELQEHSFNDFELRDPEVRLLFLEIFDQSESGDLEASPEIKDENSAKRAMLEISRPKIIRALSQRARFIELLRVLLAAWSSFAALFFMAFHEELQQHNTRAFWIIFLLDCGLEIFHAVTLFLQFRTSVLILHEGTEVMQRALIRYMLTRKLTFWADVVALFPWQLLYLQNAWMHQGVGASPAVLFLAPKLLRVWRLYAMPIDQQQLPTLRRYELVFFRLLLLVLCGGHAFGCLWFTILKLTGTLQLHMVLVGAEDVQEASGGWGGRSVLFYYFARSFLNGMYLMLGFDRDGHSDAECLFLALAAPLGALFHTCILTTILFELQQLRLIDNHHAERIQVARQAMDTLSVPNSLQLRVLAYHEFLRIHRFSAAQGMVGSLLADLSSNLSVELKLFLYHDIVKNSSLFQRTHPTVIRLIVLALHDQTFLPGDLVVRAGEAGLEMYFVLKGTLAVLKKLKAPAQGWQSLLTIGGGDFFGEIALLTGAKRKAYVRADSFCVLARLPKSQFVPILDQFPEQRNVMMTGMQIPGINPNPRVDSRAPSALSRKSRSAAPSRSASPSVDPGSNAKNQLQAPRIVIGHQPESPDKNTLTVPHSALNHVTVSNSSSKEESGEAKTQNQLVNDLPSKCSSEDLVLEAQMVLNNGPAHSPSAPDPVGGPPAPTSSVPPILPISKAGCTDSAGTEATNSADVTGDVDGTPLVPVDATFNADDLLPEKNEDEDAPQRKTLEKVLLGPEDRFKTSRPPSGLEHAEVNAAAGSRRGSQMGSRRSSWAGSRRGSRRNSVDKALVQSVTQALSGSRKNSSSNILNMDKVPFPDNFSKESSDSEQSSGFNSIAGSVKGSEEEAAEALGGLSRRGSVTSNSAIPSVFPPSRRESLGAAYNSYRNASGFLPPSATLGELRAFIPSDLSGSSMPGSAMRSRRMSADVENLARSAEDARSFKEVKAELQYLRTENARLNAEMTGLRQEMRDGFAGIAQLFKSN
eukprot:gnl/MRDRNA2_/MRDRNA2_33698_c0_seq1.p1 gnl/MRDRNA2_/MRDRNA2_33698_c0~~gnl/MRDRNA2_/MRDRNA2_33698_c0_seq1.p1  ORF type:complete len:1211 (+),score=199.24 gnl/MRDRNA2_/MRDRNA2_33698_c0_seq1:81-3713(+)